MLCATILRPLVRMTKFSRRHYFQGRVRTTIMTHDSQRRSASWFAVAVALIGCKSSQPTDTGPAKTPHASIQRLSEVVTEGKADGLDTKSLRPAVRGAVLPSDEVFYRHLQCSAGFKTFQSSTGGFDHNLTDLIALFYDDPNDDRFGGYTFVRAEEVILPTGPVEETYAVGSSWKGCRVLKEFSLSNDWHLLFQLQDSAQTTGRKDTRKASVRFLVFDGNYYFKP